MLDAESENELWTSALGAWRAVEPEDENDLSLNHMLEILLESTATLELMERDGELTVARIVSLEWSG